MTVDGSVRRDQASAAVIVKDDDGRITRISILVDGSPKDLNVYRADLSAIYSGYLWMERLTPSTMDKHKGYHLVGQ